MSKFNARLFGAFAMIVLALGTPAHASDLGDVVFETSGHPSAQARFLRGVAALHSFWYEVAIEEFRAATKIDPGFMMGYWGEAMSYNYPLWGSRQDYAKAKKALAKLVETTKLTDKERGFLAAVKKLYGEGPKADRDQAYAGAMGAMHEKYPDDLEIETFYALALIGSSDPNDPRELRTRMKAGSVALDAFQKNPNHPGAAHYVIHAFDDPDHAHLAFPAAERYTQIAPAAPHALHMPSHIFLQLGMWDAVAASNRAAWQASVDWVTANKLAAVDRDSHALEWLSYAYVQAGHYEKALDAINLLNEKNPSAPSEESQNFSNPDYLDMASAFIIDTELWDHVRLLPDFADVNSTRSDRTSVDDQAVARVIFVHGFVAAKRGLKDAGKFISALKKIGGNGTRNASPTARRMLEIQLLELSALENVSKRRFDEAIKDMKLATEAESKLPAPSGPPQVAKPSYELFGEILLAADRPNDAAQMFAESLYRHPDRARSLLGAARAAGKTGKKDEALKLYSKLLVQWKEADTGLVELKEARDFVMSANGRPGG